jgi:hypothetical protein
MNKYLQYTVNFIHFFIILVANYCIFFSMYEIEISDGIGSSSLTIFYILAIYIIIIIFLLFLIIFKKLQNQLFINTLILTSIFSFFSIINYYDYYFDYDNLTLDQKENIRLSYNLYHHFFLLIFNLLAAILIFFRFRYSRVSQ